MMGQTDVMSKSAKCTAAVTTAFTIAKFGADDDTVDVASGATDNLIGIFQHTTAAAGDEARVMLDGISRCKLGGTVTRGDPITADANAKGVKASLGQSVVSYALASGVAGDVIPVLLKQSMLAPNQGTDGLTVKGILRVTYDFAVNGGAVGAIPLAVTLPDKAVISRGYGDIITAFTSTGGTGTIALGANTGNDLLAAVDADTLSGQFDLIPAGAIANFVKATAARVITLTVATNAITAGKAIFFLEYVISQ